jgi:hypothetical protein
VAFSVECSSMIRSGVNRLATRMPMGVTMTMNQPMSWTSVAGLVLPASVGTNSTAVAAMVLTIWIAPKTRERSWYFEAITEAQEACESAITDVPR